MQTVKNLLEFNKCKLSYIKHININVSKLELNLSIDSITTVIKRFKLNGNLTRHLLKNKDIFMFNIYPIYPFEHYFFYGSKKFL